MIEARSAAVAVIRDTGEKADGLRKLDGLEADELNYGRARRTNETILGRSDSTSTSPRRIWNASSVSVRPRRTSRALPPVPCTETSAKNEGARNTMVGEIACCRPANYAGLFSKDVA